MNSTPSIYRGFCFPGEIVSHAVFLYHRFSLSLRDIEELLALRGITVSYESIRRWSRGFGPQLARKLRREQGTLADHWLLDEVFVNIQGRRHYLWRAIDQNGDVIDILLQRRRNARAARRFFRKLLKGQQRSHPIGWLPTNSEVIEWRTERKCPAFPTTRPNTLTTESKHPTAVHGSGNDRCWGFVQWEAHNDFSVSSPSYRTYSIALVII